MTGQVVVVGAGIAGLLAARELRAAGADVVVLEKSRGVGGRMATKRIGEAVFDHGAQFFTAREAAFQAEVEAWAERGHVERWPGVAARRWIGRPGMTAVAKALAAELTVRREHKVTAAHRHDCGCWELHVEGQGIWRTERLVLAAPLPQSLALLRAGEVTLPAPWAETLAAVRYHACLAVLVTLAAPSAVPAEGASPEDGPIRWVADNTRKGAAPGVAAAVTIHLRPGYSEEHYAAAEATVVADILPQARRWLGEAAVLDARVHRWRFSEPTTTVPEAAVWLPELGLGFCGDAFGGPKVEGAALSGLALARKLGGTMGPS